MNKVSGGVLHPSINSYKKPVRYDDYPEGTLGLDEESSEEVQPASEAGMTPSGGSTLCDLNDNIHPVEDFNCGISFDQMKMPGVLSCGHFFELQQIDLYRRIRLENKQDFLCPKGCGKVEDKIIESKQLRNGIEDSRNQIFDLQKVALEIEQRLMSKILEESAKTKAEMEAKAKAVAKAEVAASNQKIISNSLELLSTSKRIAAVSKEILEQSRTLEELQVINKKQIDNIKSKGFIDNAYVIFWPKYELDILNRGLTPKQLSILKNESENKEKREIKRNELEKELADLVLKRATLKAELNLNK